MIALAGFVNRNKSSINTESLVANGSLKIDTNI
jgi:hypothetical protein